MIWKKSVSGVHERQINQNSQFWTNKFPNLSVYSALKYGFPRGIYSNHWFSRPLWTLGQKKAITWSRLPAVAGDQTCKHTRSFPGTSEAGINVCEQRTGHCPGALSQVGWLYFTSNKRGRKIAQSMVVLRIFPAPVHIHNLLGTVGH